METNNKPGFFLLIGRSLSFFMLTVGTFYLGYIGKSVEMGLSIVGGSLGLTFTNLNKIIYVKTKLIEFKLRDVIDRAYSTIEEMQTLSKVLGEISITAVTYIGRYSTSDLVVAQQKNVEQVKGLLIKLGISKEDLKSITKMYFEIKKRDHITCIADYLDKHVITDENKKKNMRIFFGKSYDDDDYLKTPEEIINFLKAENIENKKTEEKIEDYKYFIENQTFRRPNNCIVSE